VSSLLYPHRISLIGSEHFHARADPTDDGRTNENGLQLLPAGVDLCDAAIDLPTVGIALDGDVHQREARLRGTGNLSCKKNGAGARSENGLALSEGAQRFKKIFQADQLKHGGTFPARDDQTIARSQILSRADFNGTHMGALQSPHMRKEIALEGEDAYVLQLLVTLNNRHAL
jgi:hypothetical protein